MNRFPVISRRRIAHWVAEAWSLAADCAAFPYRWAAVRVHVWRLRARRDRS